MNSGKVKVSLKLGFLPLPGKTFDLCELLEDAGESCPVEEGKFSIKLALEIPRATPGVSRHYTAVGLNGGVVLVGLQVKVTWQARVYH